MEFRPDGEIVRTVVASPPFYTDPHELLLTASEAGGEWVHLFGYDLRRVDLSSLGGSPNALLAGHVILRESLDGSVEFLWNSWDHITLQDWLNRPANLAADTLDDFDHPNSLAFDLDGNYIASFADLYEITKID